MDSKQVMLKGYMSHSIRGNKGSACSAEEMTANSMKAAGGGGQLMALFQHCGLPVYLHVPGAHDEFVQKAYLANRITEKEILDTDCDIIGECDFMLVYDWQDYISVGMKIEADYADSKKIPVFMLKQIDQESVWRLQSFLIELLLDKLNTPNIIQIKGGV